MSHISMIAIVDDDGAVREATETLLRSGGYHASTFASAEEQILAATSGPVRSPVAGTTIVARIARPASAARCSV